MRFFILVAFFFTLLFAGCQTKEMIFLAQGIMSGEAAENSIILQARLTANDTLTSGDVSGYPGVGRFEISEKQNFSSSE